MATFLKLIKLQLGVLTLFGCEFLFLKSNTPNSPSPPRGGSPGEGGFILGGSCGYILKLLSSNLVCKPYLGVNFYF